jgi:aquaporin NIP
MTMISATESFAAALPVTSTTRLLRKVGAEMIGTFALVFAGCGAIMADHISGGAVSHVGVGLTFGLVIMVMIYATGHVSGAHFNPAVTIAFASIGRFPWKQVPAYVIGQITAASLASLCLYTLFGPVTGSMTDLGATAPAGAATQALVLEIIITFFLMFVITAVATDSRAVGQMAGWAIGGTVALAAIFAGPISGASMNPARSLGPALVAAQLDHLWIYMAGPLLGAMLGAWTYKLVRCGGEEQTAGGCC